jgi:hypothetical protein
MEKAAYKSLEHYYGKTFTDTPETLQFTLSQMTSNLEYVYKRFDHMDIPQSLELIKKSFVMGFEYEFCPNSLNAVNLCKSIERRKPEAKSKLLFIINRLWLYRLAN